MFTNTGGSTCELYGYPGVSLVAGDDGHQVGAPASHSGGRTAALLLPRGHATAPLSIVTAAAFPVATCQPTQARGLRVYPPGQTAALYVPRPTDACASAADVVLGVQSVRPGSP